MSTRNDQDEPLATREESSSSDPFDVRRVNQVDTPVNTQAQYAVASPAGGGLRAERSDAVAQAGIFERFKNFVRETRDEMRRVSWPSATEVKNTTIITIVAVIFFAAYLFIVDRSFTFLIEGLTSLLSRLV